MIGLSSEPRRDDGARLVYNFEKKGGRPKYN